MALKPQDIDAGYINRKVVPVGDCLVWTGADNGFGYGMYVNGGLRTTAHRASYTLHKGEIPDGFNVHHLCRNRKCVKAEHLSALPEHLHMKLHHDPFAADLRLAGLKKQRAKHSAVA